MTRDMDLIRELLLKLEAMPIRRGGIILLLPDEEELQVAGYTPDQIDYHLAQIRASGWIDDGDIRPMKGLGFRRLTPAGHDFLDAVRNSENWTKTKTVATNAGGFTLDLLKDLAKGLIKLKIAELSGVHL